MHWLWKARLKSVIVTHGICLRSLSLVPFCLRDIVQWIYIMLTTRTQNKRDEHVQSLCILLIPTPQKYKISLDEVLQLPPASCVRCGRPSWKRKVSLPTCPSGIQPATPLWRTTATRWYVCAVDISGRREDPQKNRDFDRSDSVEFGSALNDALFEEIIGILQPAFHRWISGLQSLNDIFAPKCVGKYKSHRRFRIVATIVITNAKSGGWKKNNAEHSLQ